MVKILKFLIGVILIGVLFSLTSAFFSNVITSNEEKRNSANEIYNILTDSGNEINLAGKDLLNNNSTCVNKSWKNGVPPPLFEGDVYSQMIKTPPQFNNETLNKNLLSYFQEARQAENYRIDIGNPTSCDNLTDDQSFSYNKMREKILGSSNLSLLLIEELEPERVSKFLGVF